MPTLTGNNRRREQRLQELLLLRLSQQFERRLSREIARAMREGATALDRGAVSPSDAIRERHDRNITRLLGSVWSRSITDMAEHMLGAKRSWAGRIERKQEGFDADAFLRTWIATEGVTKVRRITSTTQESIRRMIEQGARDGLGQREVGKLIRARAPSIAAARSQVIARTEVHSASQSAAQAVAEDSGLDMRRVWVSSRGERTRTIADGAQFDHLAADGQTVRMDQPFVIEGLRGSEELRYPGDPHGSAGNVINCFDGDVPVAFDSCKKSIASRYSGEIITVETAAGYKVTGTPNHPVMTDSGPIPLGQVNHFTNLVCCPLNRNIAKGFDVKNVPTTFKEIHDSLSIVGVRVRVGAVPVNLYGRTPNSDVDIVRAKRILRNGIKPSGVKRGFKLCLKMTNFRQAFKLGLRLLNRVGSMKLFRRVSHSLISCRNLGSSLLAGHSGPFYGFRFTLAPNMDAVRCKNSPDWSSTAPKRVRNAFFADSRFIKIDDFLLIKSGSLAPGFDAGCLNHFVDVAGANAHGAGDIVTSFSRHVHLDNAVSIKVKRVSEHKVYTIETEEGFYNAGGIIAQNCRCVVVYEVV